MLTQAGLVRHFAAFHTTDHKDQACLYLLEDCLITSLLAFDQAAGKECAEWLVKFRVFPNDYLFNFVTDVCCRKYLFETSAKKRFKTLPAILRMLDWWSPEYKAYAEATRKTAEKLGCSPRELRDDRESPKFKRRTQLLCTSEGGWAALSELVNHACIYDMIVVEPVAAYNARRSVPESKPMPLIDIDREMISFIGCTCYPPRFMSVINRLAQTREFTKRSDREAFKRVAIARLGRLVRQRVVERYKRKFVQMPGASFHTNRSELAEGHGRLL